ncbi:hypothetical protein AB4090_03960 [Acidithiobacillus sp. IBUN Pt1247-S3]|uniref:hypothetical protein n=1 Tax=Acidithiobacillus sp. IBUN Pt1247-S3 TaxID=3166642 RepID=UPI0034E5983D
MSTHTPRQIAERLEIAILTSEQMRLHWVDDKDQTHYMTVVLPLALEEGDAADYLHCRVLEDNLEIRVRVDLIQNLPAPVK